MKMEDGGLRTCHARAPSPIASALRVSAVLQKSNQFNKRLDRVAAQEGWGCCLRTNMEFPEHRAGKLAVVA